MTSSFAILTAIPIEWEAMCKRLTNTNDPIDQTLPTKFGQIENHTVVCVLSGKGGANTASALQYVSNIWKPRWVLLVGVAGGFPDKNVKLGDVIIASFVYGVDFGKLVEGKYILRPELNFPPDRSLLSHADLLAEAESQAWLEQIAVRRPDDQPSTVTKARVGYVASSDKVVDDPSHSFFKEVSATIPEIHAVEMEGHGAGPSIRLEQAHRTVGFLMIKGISDDPTSVDAGSTQRELWRKYAAAAVAAFVQAFLSHLPSQEKLPTTTAGGRNKAVRPHIGKLDGSINKIIETNSVRFITERKVNTIELQKSVDMILDKKNIKKKQFKIPFEYDGRISLLIEKLKELYERYESILTQFEIKKNEEIALGELNAIRHILNAIPDRMSRLPEVIALAIARLGKSLINIGERHDIITLTVSRVIELEMANNVHRLASYQLESEEQVLFKEYMFKENMVRTSFQLQHVPFYVSIVQNLPYENLFHYRILFKGDHEERSIYAPIVDPNLKEIEKIGREDFFPPISFLTKFVFPQIIWCDFEDPSNWNFSGIVEELFIKNLNGFYV